MAEENGSLSPESEAGSEEESLLKLKKDARDLRENLRLRRSRNVGPEAFATLQKEEDVPITSPVINLKVRKTLKGHRGRILHFDWSPDKYHVVTAGQDGQLFIWNGMTAQKEMVIQSSKWVCACSFSPSTTLLACAGTSCDCQVFQLDVGRVSTDSQLPRLTVPKKTLSAHQKYITNCLFFGSDQQILTAGADKRCAMWDMEYHEPVKTFEGHTSDILGLALNPKDPFTVFATASCDRSACIWDSRSGQCVMRFEGHEGDVNSVRFFPTGEAIGTACNDGTIRLFDLRADQEIKFYTKTGIIFGCSALDFSKSGRILFGGYNDYAIRVWDVIKGTHMAMWLNHTDRVSNVALSPDGTALGSSSWDGTLKIWA
uniref:G protein, beta subunit n=1 Tax=Geodia cydonium TaxID=6047 RepID=Q9XZV6_GEOCY|nr:G protein, beta subunit [Geodia cydonium]